MKYTFFALLFLFSNSLLAQIEGDIGRIEDYDSETGPTTIPLFIETDGQVSFKPTGGSPEIAFSPNVQFSFSKTTINYVTPVSFQEFSLDEVAQGQPWIEYKTKKIETGLGIGYQTGFKLGITPYRGSNQSTVSFKTSTVKNLKSGIPGSLEQMEQWSVHDSGHYQTYGGIAVRASFAVSGVRIVSGSIGIQNNFILGLKKLDQDRIHLSISEEDLKIRSLKFGPAPINASVTFIKGHLFSSVFELRLSDPAHHQLYQEALKGNIVELQNKLSSHSQRIVWSGRDRRFYIGIPQIAGQQKNWMDFKYGTEGEGLYIRQKKTKGMLTTFRDHKTYVHHDKKGIIVLWTSQMKKVSYSALYQKFLYRAELLKLKGFETLPPAPAQKLGTMITHMGIGFSRVELSQLQESDLALAKLYMTQTCQLQRLACQQPNILNGLFQTLSWNLKRPWLEGKRDLGISLSSNPALIQSLIKAKGWHKEAYVKFLSQRFQSFEGMTPVGISN